MTEIDWYRTLKIEGLNPTNFGALIDWLEERGDPRAENLKQSKLIYRENLDDYQFEFLHWPRKRQMQIEKAEKTFGLPITEIAKINPGILRPYGINKRDNGILGFSTDSDSGLVNSQEILIDFLIREHTS